MNATRTPADGSVGARISRPFRASSKSSTAKAICGTILTISGTWQCEVADMAKTDLRDYSLADMKVVFPSADGAVTRYKTTIQMTSEGKDRSGTYNSASVWVKKSGKWLEVLHAEVKVQ